MKSVGKVRKLPAWMQAVKLKKSEEEKVNEKRSSEFSEKGMTQSCEGACSSFLKDKVDGEVQPQAKTKKNHQENDKEKTVSQERGREGNGGVDNKRCCVQGAEEETPAKYLKLSMPLLEFPGSIVYSFQSSDCACLCQEIVTDLDKAEKTIIGFDMEWPVKFRSGTSDKTALIQICLSPNTCFLFHISPMTHFPKPLKTLILHPSIILVGLNIESDLWKLERDFDIRVKAIFNRKSVVDVGMLANKKLKSAERWDLDGLCRNVLRKRLSKETSVRCGNWDDYPLSHEQKMYAAADAYAGLLLYNHLSTLGAKMR